MQKIVFLPNLRGPVSLGGSGGGGWGNRRGHDAWYGRMVMPCVCTLKGCFEGL